MTPKRQKILSDAFTQLRKAREKIDPAVLAKIREIVAGSPALMKKLGLGSKMPPERPLVEPDLAMPLSKPVPPTSKKPVYPELTEKMEEQGGYEKIDQVKNMEIMAKLMQLNPAGREGIKAVIKKAGK